MDRALQGAADGFLLAIVAGSLLALVPPLVFRSIIDNTLPDGDSAGLAMQAGFVVGGSGGRYGDVVAGTQMVGTHR